MKLEEAIRILIWSQSQMRLGNLPDYSQNVYQSIETILQEIEHLQKENGKLTRARKWFVEHTVGQIATPEMLRKILADEYIHKDKIREKIKRLEEEEKAELSEFEKRKRLVLPTDTPYLFASAEYSWKKEVLNNLLKEE